jgi:Ni/Co efflux regulator RcnB
MRTVILVALAAATLVSSPAVARSHDRHHDGDRHHERHQRAERHDRDRHDVRRHHYSRNVRDRHHRYRAYVAPYRNWSYRRVPVGYHLRSAYYGPRYRISDYRYYGLRAPGRNLMWVRYGPDLLLVNVRTGRVVQVLPGRFY